MPAAKVDEAAEQAEFNALMAEIKAPDTDEEGDTEEAEETSDVPEEDEEAEDESEEDDLDDEDEDEGEALDANEKAAKALFESGNIKGACKRLGIDPKIFKVNPREFTAMRKGLKDGAKFKTEGLAAKAAGEKLQKDAENVYGPIVAGFQAYQRGDYTSLRSAVEIMCEDTFENVVAKVARAAKGMDPGQVEVLKLRKELKERDTKANEEQTKAQAAVQEAKEVQVLTGKLKGTPLEKVPGAAKEVYDLVRASYDGVGYGLTVKEAYAQTKAKYAALAAGFGKKLPEGKKGKNGKKLAELAPVRKDVSKLTVKERIAQKAAEEQAEFEAVLKAAKEDDRKAARAARRARK